eukprot:Pgem_evm1s8792
MGLWNKMKTWGRRVRKGITKIGSRALHNMSVSNMIKNSLRPAIQQKEIKPSTKRKALLAKSSYLPPEQRQKVIDNRYKLVKVPGLQDDLRTSVYTKNNKVYISHRGTDKKSLTDLYTDAYVVNGNLEDSRRVENSEQDYLKIKKFFGKNKIYKHVGHSLGGSVGALLADKYGDKSISYNRGNLINKDLKNNKDRVMSADPISNTILASKHNNALQVYQPKPGGNLM